MAQIDGSHKISKTGLYSVILLLEDGQNMMIDANDVEILYFIEDITVSCMTGKIIINDRYGLIEYGPFTGNEKISIKYGKNFDREQIFDIFKISKMGQSGMHNTSADMQIEIYFVDILFMPLTINKYSRSFGADAKYSDILKHLLQNMIGLSDNFLQINESTNIINNYIMPYWTILQTINFLSERAEDKAGAGCLFFNNTDNGFKVNFKSYNWLNSTDNYKEENEYIFESVNVEDENKILEYWINGLDKYSNKFLRGGKFLGYDFETKSLVEKDFDYSDGIDSSILLGKTSLYPDISQIAAVNLYGDTTEKELENRAYSAWIKRYQKQFIVNFIVEGREDRFAGQQIEVKWPSVDKKEFYNKALKGNYLIKTVTHMFGRDRTFPYKQRLVCIKNAYNDIDSKDLLKTTNYNI